MGSSSRTRKLERGLGSLGCSVLLILVLELGSRLILFVGGDLLHLGLGEGLAAKPAFEGVSYDAEALLIEQESLPHQAYEPYAVWRSPAVRGRFFGVSETGERRTVPSSNDPEALEVWMLGGSTLFGYGAPDDQTLPSHLARLLHEEGIPARVRNLGQGGYVSTQELLTVLRRLQDEEAPHAVVFYDGYNDAVSAGNWPDSPGTHFQPDRIRNRFETSWAAPVYGSGLYRMTEAVLARLPRPATGPRSPEETQRRAAVGARVWLANARAARALGGTWGFPAVLFLQPADGHSLFEEIRSVILDDPSAAGLGVHDLGDLFRGEEESFFIDTVHITGPGNERVATKMLPLLLDELCARPPSSRPLPVTLESRCPPPEEAGP